MPQIRFPETVCVSGIKIGGVPNAGTGNDAPYIRVFAKSVSLLASARFSCLLEHEHLPELQTTKAVRFEVCPAGHYWHFFFLARAMSKGTGIKCGIRMQVTPTDTLVVRGKFQTLPLAIYGWTLPPGLGTVSPILASAIDSIGAHSASLYMPLQCALTWLYYGSMASRWSQGKSWTFPCNLEAVFAGAQPASSMKPQIPEKRRWQHHVWRLIMLFE